jgi:hypothetical protein
MLRSSTLREGVWSLAKRIFANSFPNDVEELVEDVIRSINGIRIFSRKCAAAYWHPDCSLSCANLSPYCSDQ